MLPRRKTKYTEAEVLYRADARTCNACPVKTQCTASDHGRMVHRSFAEDYLEKVRGYHATEAYQKAMRKRKVWVEPLFAEAKEWHGLRRLRLRGLENVNIQGLLIAAGQNLKRFLAATGWGRRHAPCGSLWPSREHHGGSRRLRVITYPARTGSRDEVVPHSQPLDRSAGPQSIFQHAGPLSAPPCLSTDVAARNQAHSWM